MRDSFLQPPPVFPLHPQTPSTHLCWLCTAGCPSSCRVRGVGFWFQCPQLRSQRARWRTCFHVVWFSLAWMRGGKMCESELWRTDSWSATQRARRRKRREKDDRRPTGEEEKCRTAARGLREWDCSQRERACECMLRAYEQGFPEWLVPPEHPSAAKKTPPPLKGLLFLRCSTDGGWGRDGGAGFPPAVCKKYTFTHTSTEDTEHTTAACSSAVAMAITNPYENQTAWRKVVVWNRFWKICVMKHFLIIPLKSYQYILYVFGMNENYEI